MFMLITKAINYGIPIHFLWGKISDSKTKDAL